MAREPVQLNNAELDSISAGAASARATGRVNGETATVTAPPGGTVIISNSGGYAIIKAAASGNTSSAAAKAVITN